MEKELILYKGKRLYIPYNENMNITISCPHFDNYNIQALANNRTEKYAECVNITKFLSRNQLSLRMIHCIQDSIGIHYQNNGHVMTMIVDETEVDINTNETTITLSVDHELNTHIQIVSSDKVIDETTVNTQMQENEKIVNQYQQFQQEYETLQKQYEQYNDKLQSLIQKCQQYQQDNKTLEKQIIQFEKDIKDLEEMNFKYNDQTKELEMKLQSELKQRDMTLDILKYYQESDKTEDIEKVLDDVEKQLKVAKDMLKSMIETRQREVIDIRQKIQP